MIVNNAMYVIHMCIYIYMCIRIQTYTIDRETERERERARGREGERGMRVCMCMRFIYDSAHLCINNFRFFGGETQGGFGGSIDLFFDSFIVISYILFTKQ